MNLHILTSVTVTAEEMILPSLFSSLDSDLWVVSYLVFATNISFRIMPKPFAMVSSDHNTVFTTLYGVF